MIKWIYKIYNPNAKRDKHGRVIQDRARRKHSKKVRQKLELENRTRPRKFRVRPKGAIDVIGRTK